MKKNVLEISPKYIVDSSGKKTEVVLDISTFEKMLEGLEDLYFGLRSEQALEEGKFTASAIAKGGGWIDFDEANKKFLEK